MKQPDDLSPGKSRKTLLKRNVRRDQLPVGLRKSARKKGGVDKQLEPELLKIFSQK
jgi:hypothetical protein